jgi:hypothetical protein
MQDTVLIVAAVAIAIALLLTAVHFFGGYGAILGGVCLACAIEERGR